MLIAAALLAALGVWCAAARSAAFDTDGVRYAVEEDGLRYEYNAVLGIACLLDSRSAAPGDDVSAARPDDAARLRGILLAHAGTDSLEALREPHRRTIENLRAYGYLK